MSMTKNIEALRKVIMDEIFDQQVALKALDILDGVKAELQLSKERVGHREDLLQESLVELGIDYDQAMDLIREMSVVIDQNDPEHPVMQKYFAYMCK